MLRPENLRKSGTCTVPTAKAYLAEDAAGEEQRAVVGGTAVLLGENKPSQDSRLPAPTMVEMLFFFFSISFEIWIALAF